MTRCKCCVDLGNDYAKPLLTIATVHVDYFAIASDPDEMRNAVNAI